MALSSTRSNELLFHVDPSFCPHCGLILSLPGTSDTVTCKLCGYEQDAEVYENYVEYTCKYFAVKKDKVTAGTQGDGPLADHECPNCGNEQMSYSTQQTRSADEGQTVFYTCPQCKFKETENS